MFAKIEDNYRQELKDAFLKKIKTDFPQEEVDDGYSMYEVEIQKIKFRTFMNDEELSRSIDYAIDILEELKSINNNGLSEERLRELEENHKNSFKDDEELSYMLLPISVYNEFSTQELELILHKVANMRRVGGAYWMLLSRPGLISAIYAVYDRIVDNFDDENIYIQSIYFLLRAIMKVRSEEIDKDFEKEKNKNE